MQHRYYGKSMPFGSVEEALKNASTLGYLYASQALADYATILLDVNETIRSYGGSKSIYMFNIIYHMAYVIFTREHVTISNFVWR